MLEDKELKLIIANAVLKSAIEKNLDDPEVKVDIQAKVKNLKKGMSAKEMYELYEKIMDRLVSGDYEILKKSVSAKKIEVSTMFDEIYCDIKISYKYEDA